MKQAILLLIILLGFSFVKKDKALLLPDSYARIYKTERYFGHRFFYGTIKQDTLVFVSKDKGLPTAVKQVPFYIDTIGLKDVKWLIRIKDTLYFNYFSKPFSVGEFRGRVLTGIGAPGSHKLDMNTFSSFPFLIGNPKSFKIELKN